MRAELLLSFAVAAVPLTAVELQRGLVRGVTVPRAPAQVGVPVDITVTGTNPCGAVRITPGDGTEPITHPLEQLPATRQHVYRAAGRFEIRAEGMGNCDGVVATSIQVVAAPAPPPAPHPDAPPPARIRDMDTDRDGVVTRAEWRGTDDAFRAQDTNGDGVLSGAEVRDRWSEVIVKGTDRWTRTGMSVRAGDVIRLESSGTVQLSADAGDTSSPGGAASARRAPSAPFPDAPAGGLIARIGNARPLYVGADRTVRANASGQLYLGINDDDLGDNRGEFRVRIETPGRGGSRR